MTSIGTLVAFLVVSVGVIMLRRTAPDLPRGFKVPGYPVMPILSVLGCIWIIIGLRPITIVGLPDLGRGGAGLVLQLRDQALAARGCRGARGAGRDAWSSGCRATSAPPGHGTGWRCSPAPGRGPGRRDGGAADLAGRAAAGWTRSTRSSSSRRPRRRWTGPAGCCPPASPPSSWWPARSAPAGLQELAERHAAGMLVLGSSTAGVLGRVAFGSVAERLLHTSPVPVALAPRGFRAAPDGRGRRVTAAFGGAGRRRRAGGRARPGWPRGPARRCGWRRSRCTRAPRSRPGSAPGPRTASSTSGPATSEPPSRPALAAVAALPRPARRSAAVGPGPRLGRRRWRTSAGGTPTCSSSAPARPARWPGCSSARARRRSCGTRRCRWSWCRADRPPRWPRRPGRLAARAR